MPPHMNQTPDMDDAAVQPDSLSVRLQAIGLQRPGEALKQPERNISASRRIIPVNPEVVVFVLTPAGGDPHLGFFYLSFAMCRIVDAAESCLVHVDDCRSTEMAEKERIFRPPLSHLSGR